VYLDTMLDMGVTEQAHRGGTLAARAGLIALMLVGSLALWLGDPVLWLWITARLQSTQASMGPYALMLVGITLTAVAIGKGLARLNRLYAEVTGTAPTVRIIVPWRRSMRDGRHGGSSDDDDARVPVGLLEVFMVIAVLIAVTALLLWFLVVHPAPPLPGGPGGAKR
jgi:prolipoprotein diacylglyceryltransferase